MIPVVCAIALAGDHDAQAPAAIVVERRSIPAGAPIVVVLAPDDDLQAKIYALPAGSTIRLGPGTWPGPVIVDRPLSLVGTGAVIDGHGRGSVLTLAADDVHIRGLRVTGGGHVSQANDSGIVAAGHRFRIIDVTVDDVYLGIDVRGGDDGRIEGCTILGPGTGSFGLRGDGVRLWEASRTEVIGNVIDGVRDLVVWYANDNHIAENKVSRSRYGTHFMNTTGNVVERNTYEDNIVGVFSMYSRGVRIADNRMIGADGSAGMGIGLKDSDSVVVTGNTLVANTTGLYLDNTPHDIGGTAEISANVIAANDIGVRLHGSQRGPVFSRNHIASNGVAVTADGGSDASGSVFTGNAWSDYAGYDLDGDDHGDLPFEYTSMAGALRERRPALAFFQGTPAASLLDLFAAAFPMFAPKPVLRDERPWMAP